MVPVEALPLKQQVGYHSENDERNALLYHLQLYQRKRTTIALKTDTVRWHLTAVLKEGYGPRESDDGDEWPVGAGSRLL